MAIEGMTIARREFVWLAGCAAASGALPARVMGLGIEPTSGVQTVENGIVYWQRGDVLLASVDGQYWYRVSRKRENARG